MLTIPQRLQAVKDRIDHQGLIAASFGVATHADLRQADALGLKQ